VSTGGGGATRSSDADRIGVESFPATERPAAVMARDVFKIYKRGANETVALRGASLTVERGEFVCLEGPSGSGKTSLLSILTGLAAPSAGDVVVDGQRLTELDEAGLARWRAARVGMVFQKGNLIPFLSAEENVALIASQRMGRRQARKHAQDLLSSLGLGNRSTHRATQLSGGEVQRAGIAVALANDPAVIVGDELTGELDSETADDVMNALMSRQRERGLTMLLVTHNPAIAELADRRLVLSGGLVTSR
jgi:putative ABC transport system ATP-binding protein